MSDISATGVTIKPPTATLPPGDTATSAASSSSSNDGLGANGVNADTFLQLLVAQMKYQDPDSPVDSTQFLAQTAAFEEVQELSSLQSSLTSLVSSEQAGAATSMLGQQVTGADASGNPVSGVVTGIQLTSSGPVLTVGNGTVPFSSVTSVMSPDSAAAGPSTAAASSTTTTGTTTGTTTTDTTTGASAANSPAAGASGDSSSTTSGPNQGY